MAKIITNTLRIKQNAHLVRPSIAEKLRLPKSDNLLPKNAKYLAWGIFLILFIESGTLGLLPRQFYFVYRNMRISDLLVYALTVYSLFNVREFIELYKSRAAIIVKLLFIYLLMQYIVSSILYEVNVIEYFFRLKGIWASFLVFPYLLLLKRNAFNYLIKLIFPVAVISNILYILSAVTGTAFLPDIGIAKQTLPGGFQVYRVFGGTFYGELFFLGFIYNWITNKFRMYQLFFVILFITPHILAFGRSAWLFFTFTIVLMMMWNFLKKRELKIFLRQTAVIGILGVVLVYSFMKFVPQSEYLVSAIEARVIQAEDDIKYKEGTYGTRLINIDALINLWLNSNVLFGIGMHPMWVIKPVTEEENIYVWGFSDVRWAAVLAAYGAVGFLLAVIFQINYIWISIKILKKSIANDIPTFFTLIFLTQLLFDSFINYSYNLFTFGLFGFSFYFSFYIAAVIFKYENINK